jgi:hypothetical protein
MTRPTNGQTTVEVWSDEQRNLGEFETSTAPTETVRPNTIDDGTIPAVLSREVAAVVDTLEAAE